MLKTVDLFAGAGGLSYGFELTDEFIIVAAAENNKNAQKTYIANHKGQDGIVMISDVRGYNFKELAEQKNGIDVVIGGPPCQGFSNANRQKNHIVSMNNSLVKEFFRAIKEMKPKAFVMENVAMLASDTHKFYDSRRDHQEIQELGILMNRDELVLAEEGYDDFSLMDIFKNNITSQYSIPEDLFQFLNVLYKNRKNTERLEKFIIKNAVIITKLMEKSPVMIEKYSNIQEYIIDCLNRSTFIDSGEKLGSFIRFQKSFRLKMELDENEIIYELNENPITGKITASVNSYTVFEYVNKILGETYIKNCGVVNSLWFGVPQERRRFIMIGINRDYTDIEKIDMPIARDNNTIVSVGQAIMDLIGYETTGVVNENSCQEYHEGDSVSEYAKIMREGSKGVQNHIVPNTREKAKERFAALHEGENFHKLSEDLKENYSDPSRTQNSIYLRLSSSKPSGTVINVRKSMWIHPTLDRAISIREAARLQSFPDKFIFKGPKDSQYQQVGNAVPPLMAKGIAEHILQYL